MIDKQTIDWLLDSDVSIQYQVYRDLLMIDRPDLKARISKEGWGAKFFSFRGDNDHWGMRVSQTEPKERMTKIYTHKKERQGS